MIATAHCVWAGAAHETMLLAREAGNCVSFTDACVLGDYAAATDFNPDKAETDQGTDMQQAADYRRKTAHRCYVPAAPPDRRLFRRLSPVTCSTFIRQVTCSGVAGIGLRLPASAVAQKRERRGSGRRAEFAD